MTACVFSQPPEKMSYQAVIRDAGNLLVASHVIGVQISVLQGSVTGTPVYVETQSSTTNANGLVTLEIGNGTPVTGTFSDIDWSTGVYYIKVETDPTGGTDYTMTVTSQLLSVPYALYAKTSGTTDILEELGLIANNYSGTMSDLEGNVYKTVKIGTQTWMAENLRANAFNNGSEVPLVNGNTDWANLSGSGHCYYWSSGEYFALRGLFGALYNWYAVANGNLCPTGWHVPTDGEWTTLINYLGGTSIAGGKLKARGSYYWEDSSGATNDFGFNALPGGYRQSNGVYFNCFKYGSWWSSSEYNSNDGISRFIDSVTNQIYWSNDDKNLGLSVRCIKNN